MVAYSFKERFIPKIRAGIKRQTIRASRTARMRHARPGDAVQLYYAMRTVHCRLIGRAVCDRVEPIVLDFDRLSIAIAGDRQREYFSRKYRDRFAVADGFENWTDLVEFWRHERNERAARGAKNGGKLGKFEGELITWTDYVDAWAEAA